MIEIKENIESKRGIRSKVAAIAAASALALTGCGADKNGEWVFAITCPEEQDVRIGDVTTGYKTADIKITCGDNESTNAPLSVELIDGEGLIVDEPANDGLQQVVVGYEYSSSIMENQDPEIAAIKIDYEGGFAQLMVRDMAIDEVSVAGNRG